MDAEMQAHAIAAVRETFEECGLPVLQPVPEWTESDAATWRHKVHDNGAEFLNMCRTLRCSPALNRL
ncbi:hypothetical protein HK101_010159, partial [Irineochytrium annulatum]